MKDDDQIRLLTEQIRQEMEKLRPQVQAEIERLQVEKENLEEQRRLRVAQERHARMLRDIVERYAHLGEETQALNRLLTSYIERDPTTSILRELSEEFSSQIDHIEQRIGVVIELIRFVLSNRHLSEEEKERVEAVYKQLDLEPAGERLRRQISQLRRSLFVLQEQRVKHGLMPPPEIALRIEDHEAEIERLQEELRSLGVE